MAHIEDDAEIVSVEKQEEMAKMTKEEIKQALEFLSLPSAPMGINEQVFLALKFLNRQIINLYGGYDDVFDDLSSLRRSHKRLEEENPRLRHYGIPPA